MSFVLLPSRVAYARVTHGGLSDTEMQLAKFLTNSTRDPLNEWVYGMDQNEVPEWISFPDQ